MLQFQHSRSALGRDQSFFIDVTNPSPFFIVSPVPRSFQIATPTCRKISTSTATKVSFCRLSYFSNYYSPPTNFRGRSEGSCNILLSLLIFRLSAPRKYCKRNMLFLLLEVVWCHFPGRQNCWVNVWPVSWVGNPGEQYGEI